MSQLETLCNLCHKKEHKKPVVKKVKQSYPYKMINNPKYRTIPARDLIFIWCEEKHGQISPELRNAYFSYTNSLFENNNDNKIIMDHLHSVCFKDRTVIQYYDIIFGLDLIKQNL